MLPSELMRMGVLTERDLENIGRIFRIEIPMYPVVVLPLELEARIIGLKKQNTRIKDWM